MNVKELIDKCNLAIEKAPHPQWADVVIKFKQSELKNNDIALIGVNGRVIDTKQDGVYVSFNAKKILEALGIGKTTKGNINA